MGQCQPASQDPASVTGPVLSDFVSGGRESADAGVVRSGNTLESILGELWELLGIRNSHCGHTVCVQRLTAGRTAEDYPRREVRRDM